MAAKSRKKQPETPPVANTSPPIEPPTVEAMVNGVISDPKSSLSDLVTAALRLALKRAVDDPRTTTPRDIGAVIEGAGRALAAQPPVATTNNAEAIQKFILNAKLPK